MIVTLHDGTECSEPDCTARTSATDGRCREHSTTVFRRPVGPHALRDFQPAPLRKSLVLRGRES